MRLRDILKNIIWGLVLVNVGLFLFASIFPGLGWALFATVPISVVISVVFALAIAFLDHIQREKFKDSELVRKGEVESSKPSDVYKIATILFVTLGTGLVSYKLVTLDDGAIGAFLIVLPLYIAFLLFSSKIPFPRLSVLLSVLFLSGALLFFFFYNSLNNIIALFLREFYY